MGKLSSECMRLLNCRSAFGSKGKTKVPNSKKALLKVIILCHISWFRIEAASYPDVSLSMKMCAQRKAGRRQRARRRSLRNRSSPVARLCLAKNEAPEEEAGIEAGDCETRADWWWTAREHGKGKEGRCSHVFPSRLPLHANFHRQSDVWVRGNHIT